MLRKSVIIATVLTMCMPFSAIASTPLETVTAPTEIVRPTPITIPVTVKMQGVISLTDNGRTRLPTVYMTTAIGKTTLAPSSVTKSLIALKGKVVNVTGYFNVVYKEDGTVAPSLIAPSFVVKSYEVAKNQETLVGRIVVTPPRVCATDETVCSLKQIIYLKTSDKKLVLLTGNTAALAKANGQTVSVTGIAYPINIGHQLNVITYEMLGEINIGLNSVSN